MERGARRERDREIVGKRESESERGKQIKVLRRPPLPH